MKNIFYLFTCILFYTFTIMLNKSEAQLLNGYNQEFYSSVYSSAEGIAMPFLLQQGYKTLPGVTIYNDTMLMYNAQVYTINSRYQNPESGNPNLYYLEQGQYNQYQIDIFKNVWPLHIPNDFYNYTDHSFSSLADCVGYGTRLLSAVGDTTDAENAYLKLIKTIKTANTTLIADKGFVASAYQIGAAFPTLPDVDPVGWVYVSGNVNADSINAYNQRTDPTVLQYNGRVKGNFNLAQQGDILSFSYAPGGNSNGHFMVIANNPYLLTSDSIRRFYPNVSDPEIQNFLNTYNVYGTPVYDCSGKKAHFHDSRIYMSGIGHGVLWILTQPSTDIPLGFIFEPPSDTVTAIRPILLDDANTWAITIGRSALSALPVELSSFTALINGRDVSLNWTTASEVNNSHFEIERSIVNSQWSIAGSVQGNGTTLSSSNYSFTDKGLNTGLYKYRLKQIDFNGNFEYFNLSNEINISTPLKFDLSQNYPNPFNPSTKINYNLPSSGKVTLRILDVSGREVSTLVNDVQTAGYYSITFNGNNFSSGIYFYTIESGSFIQTKKMLLIK